MRMLIGGESNKLSVLLLLSLSCHRLVVWRRPVNKHCSKNCSRERSGLLPCLGKLCFVVGMCNLQDWMDINTSPLTCKAAPIDLFTCVFSCFPQFSFNSRPISRLFHFILRTRLCMGHFQIGPYSFSKWAEVSVYLYITDYM